MNGKVQTVITWGFAACFASILYPTIDMIDDMDTSLVWFLQHCPWQKVDPRCVHLLSSTARTGRNLCQIRSRWSWIAQLQLTKTLPCFYSTKKKKPADNSRDGKLYKLWSGKDEEDHVHDTYGYLSQLQISLKMIGLLPIWMIWPWLYGLNARISRNLGCLKWTQNRSLFIG